MKKEFIYALSAVLVLSLSIPVTAATDLTNPGFETGDFTGWVVTLNPGASAAAVSSFTSDGGTNYTSPPGNYFALLKTDGPGSETIISQTFMADAWDCIGGRAFFDAQDWYNDYAYVKIIDPLIKNGFKIMFSWRMVGGGLFTIPITDNFNQIKIEDFINNYRRYKERSIYTLQFHHANINNEQFELLSEVIYFLKNKEKRFFLKPSELFNDKNYV